MMLTRDEVTPLIQETAYWWAACWDSSTRQPDRKARFVRGGEERLDELTSRLGYEIGTNLKLNDWKSFVKNTAILATELRFQIFEDRGDAVQASLNVVCMLLERAGFRPINSAGWAEFSEALQTILRNPKRYDKDVAKCIRNHLSRS